MSWGERSCKHFGRCPIPLECTYETCNHKCRKYENNGTPTETERMQGKMTHTPRVVCEASHPLYGTCEGTKGHQGPHHVKRNKWKAK